MIAYHGSNTTSPVSPKFLPLQHVCAAVRVNADDAGIKPIIGIGPHPNVGVRTSSCNPPRHTPQAHPPPAPHNKSISHGGSEPCYPSGAASHSSHGRGSCIPYPWRWFLRCRPSYLPSKQQCLHDCPPVGEPARGGWPHYPPQQVAHRRHYAPPPSMAPFPKGAPSPVTTGPAVGNAAMQA